MWVMADIFVKIALPLLEQNLINEEVMPRVHEAIGAVAETAKARWQKAIMHARGVWSVEKIQYANSIQWQYTGALQASVSTTYKYASQIENGRPARDLKAMLNTSKKVRISHSKKHAGQKYLIIPFRHNTPGSEAHAPAMAAHIYKQAAGLAPSRIIGKTTRPSGQNPKTHVNQNIYQWGGRLPAGLAPKLKPSHKTDIYAGMHRFDTSSGKQKSSAYVTFRIMGQWSAGWIVPAKPGLHLAKTVANNLKPVAEKVIWQAVITDAMS